MPVLTQLLPLLPCSTHSSIPELKCPAWGWSKVIKSRNSSIELRTKEHFITLEFQLPMQLCWLKPAGWALAGGESGVVPFGRSAQSALQQCQEPPARAEHRLCFWAHSHVLSASVLGASGQFTDACSPVPKQGVFLADRRQAPRALSLVGNGCEYTAPLDRRELGYCGLFQKKSKPASFSLAQPERTGMGPCRAMVLSSDVLLGCLAQWRMLVPPLWVGNCD